MIKVEIRKAMPDDYASVAAIGRTTFYETWRKVNTEEDMQIYMAEAFNDENVRKDINDHGNTFLLALADDRVIGYVKLRTDRTYDEFKSSKAIEIERIYVLVQYQDKKIGKALMDHCIVLAKKQAFDWLWLGVNTENFKAIDFYKKYGFVTFGTKSFKLGNAEDYDYLMNLKL